MADYVVKLKAVGVYGRFDLQQEFTEGVNIIHGKNGAGKTTFLHILTNILNADYKRFAHLVFDSIEAHLSKDRVVTILREVVDNEPRVDVRINNERICDFSISEVKHNRNKERVVRTSTGRFIQVEADPEEEYEPLLPADYFPAFRTMIEAWALTQSDRDPVRPRGNTDVRRTKATRLARDVFGKFVPNVTFPSPTDIEQQLSGEVQNALFRVAISEQESLSQAFLDIFATLPYEEAEIHQTPEEILEEINLLYRNLEESLIQAGSLAAPTGVYASLRTLLGSFTRKEQFESTVVRILDVYRRTLEKRVRIQKSSFEIINRYLDAVNEFLEGKRVEIIIRAGNTYGDPLVRTKFNDGSTSGLQTLSSGERQILTLLYAATHMSKQQVVLIDEPELSLHVDWQRLLIKKMSDQFGDRQLIVCTHSPVIAANYPGIMKELKLVNTQAPLVETQETSDEIIDGMWRDSDE